MSQHKSSSASQAKAMRQRLQAQIDDLLSKSDEQKQIEGIEKNPDNQFLNNGLGKSSIVNSAVSKELELDLTLEEQDKDHKKEYKRLQEKAIHLLSMREHSVLEMKNKLLNKSDMPDIAYAVVDKLVKDDYISDERFTESYIRSRQNRGFGPVKIRQELNVKGIKSNLIDDYLNNNSAVWFDNAQKQYNKKYGDSVISDYNTWSKYARFLQSRGYTMEQIQVTLPQISRE